MLWTGATNRGSGLVMLTTQMPFWSSRFDRKAILVLSGDQRGVEATHDGGSNWDEGRAMSRQSRSG